MAEKSIQDGYVLAWRTTREPIREGHEVKLLTFFEALEFANSKNKATPVIWHYPKKAKLAECRNCFEVAILFEHAVNCDACAEVVHKEALRTHLGIDV